MRATPPWRDLLLPGLGGTLALAAGPALWLHEMGHVLAARLLGGVPGAVVVHPLVGGRAQVALDRLNALGAALGPGGAEGAVAASGPLADILLALLLLGAGLAAGRGAVGRLLAGTAFGVAALPVFYALAAATGVASPANDFARIAHAGPPPWASFLVLAFFLVLLGRLLERWSRR